MKRSQSVLLHYRPSAAWGIRLHHQQPLLPVSVFAAAALCAPARNSTCVALQQQCRSLHVSSTLRTAAEPPVTPTANSSSAGATAGGSGVTALDVAMRVNKLKRLHQTGGGPNGKKQIELDAWSELNSLTEEQINSAEGKAVSLLLNSWAYFAKYWEKGKDGPMSAHAPAAGAGDSASSTAPRGGE
ncbi:hypothetical protein DQ04_00101320 [Trypanosoma grayi]|uniref:hypothetical protein n=1 Tax=Trypanosoma grayi TaxID=71804 RepID=UPI0004F495F2|nr:hypothetical protein DQ04_00101320 [Trypanosoma grayi]KEG15365.1 hypothetical protein DQ04_00101320 [Trypanosoma grayi]